jgi:hypothetical protein
MFDFIFELIGELFADPLFELLSYIVKSIAEFVRDISISF